MSFVEPIGGGRRVYSSSKSRWQDFGETLQLLLDTCVSKGTGGAYLVPRKFNLSLIPPPKNCSTLPSPKKRISDSSSFLTPFSVPRPHTIHPRRLRLCRGLLFRLPDELLHVHAFGDRSGSHRAELPRRRRQLYGSGRRCTLMGCVSLT